MDTVALPLLLCPSRASFCSIRVSGMSDCDMGHVWHMEQGGLRQLRCICTNTQPSTGGNMWSWSWRGNMRLSWMNHEKENLNAGLCFAVAEQCAVLWKWRCGECCFPSCSVSDAVRSDRPWLSWINAGIFRILQGIWITTPKALMRDFSMLFLSEWMENVFIFCVLVYTEVNIFRAGECADEPSMKAWTSDELLEGTR